MKMPVPPSMRLAPASKLVVLCCSLLLATLPSVPLCAQQFYRSTARPIDSLETSFPYDIQLLASSGLGGDTSLVSSTALLGQNLGRRPVLMLFWLTTCGPCRQELDALAERMEAWRGAVDFAFVPISIDFPKRRAEFHGRAGGYPWVSYLDVDREFPVVMPGKLNGVPQVFLFDAEGQLVLRQRKFRAGDLDAIALALGVK